MSANCFLPTPLAQWESLGKRRLLCSFFWYWGRCWTPTSVGCGMQQPGCLSVPRPPEKTFLPEAEGETQHFAPGDVESRTLHSSASHQPLLHLVLHHQGPQRDWINHRSSLKIDTLGCMWHTSAGTPHLSKTVKWGFRAVAVNNCNLLCLSTAAHHKSEISCRGVVTEVTKNWMFQEVKVLMPIRPLLQPWYFSWGLLALKGSTWNTDLPIKSRPDCCWNWTIHLGKPVPGISQTLPSSGAKYNHNL